MMENPKSEKGDVKKLPSVKRKAVSQSQEAWVKAGYLLPGRPLPLVIQPAVDGINLIDWATNNQEFITTHLVKHGGILFRNFDVKSVTEFERFITVVSSGEWAEYREAATPRSHVSGNIYTSTDYPADQSIFPHNENSHCTSWPLKIFFFCLTAARQGGETPIVDCRKVFERIDPKIRERFIQKKVMYVRNFGAGVGFPWQTVFRATDRAGVEEYCRNNRMEAEWKGADHLRIHYIRPAVARHPRTQEMIWFNHATFFHVSSSEPAIREALSAGFKEEDLPYNTYYGDGSPIEPSVLDELRDAYRQETVAFPWQEGDILMLDNMLAAHGRASFVGPRKVVVGMAEPFGSQEM